MSAPLAHFEPSDSVVDVAANSLNRIAWLYHFTDSRNVASIRELGGLYSREELDRLRQEYFAGGNDWSFDADELFGMHRFVHFCLRSNHPLEFLARADGRIERTTWLYVDRSVLDIEGVMFSNGVSNKSGVEIMPIGDAVARGLIDFEVLYTRTNWRDPEIKARLDHAERCEILVPNRVPLMYFENYLPNG